MVRAPLWLNNKMTHWNNFCKPSLEENFSLIFGWKYYLKDFTMREPFFNFFLIFFLWERFFPHLKVAILEDFTVEKSFSRFVFSFSSTGWVFILIFGCIFYLKEFTMQEYYSFYLFFYYWERVFSHFWVNHFFYETLIYKNVQFFVPFLLLGEFYSQSQGVPVSLRWDFWF